MAKQAPISVSWTTAGIFALMAGVANAQQTTVVTNDEALRESAAAADAITSACPSPLEQRADKVACLNTSALRTIRSAQFLGQTVDNHRRYFSRAIEDLMSEQGKNMLRGEFSIRNIEHLDAINKAVRDLKSTANQLEDMCSPLLDQLSQPAATLEDAISTIVNKMKLCNEALKTGIANLAPGESRDILDGDVDEGIKPYIKVENLREITAAIDYAIGRFNIDPLNDAIIQLPEPEAPFVK